MKAVLDDLWSKRFFARLVKQALTALGFFALVGGLADVLFPDVFEDYGTPLAIAICAGAVAYGLFTAWPRPIEHTYSAPNTSIRIVKGDLFAESGHIVVGTCDTFDTKVPTVISPNSVQGQALERIYGRDVDRLDRELADALRGETPLDHVSKEGKTERYPIGTVAPLVDGPRRVLFLAYTEMNERNEARGSSDGIWKSLLCLWKAVSEHCNGEPVAAPVIGGGQARIAQILPAQDAIRFIAFSFMLASRREKVCDELRIVVLPETYDRLDRFELQAFLDSLEMS